MRKKSEIKEEEEEKEDSGLEAEEEEQKEMAGEEWKQLTKICDVNFQEYSFICMYFTLAT